MVDPAAGRPCRRDRHEHRLGHARAATGDRVERSRRVVLVDETKSDSAELVGHGISAHDDRAAAQRTITVTAPANLAGRFEWLNDTVVQWVPNQFWPAHAEISMMVGGVPRNFGTGATVLGVAGISAHTFTVSIDGVLARQMPASMAACNSGW